MKNGTRAELIEIFKRILWSEKEMRESFASYASGLKDEGLKLKIHEMEADEIRHANMAEQALSILQK